MAYHIVKVELARGILYAADNKLCCFCLICRAVNGRIAGGVVLGRLPVELFIIAVIIPLDAINLLLVKTQWLYFFLDDFTFPIAEVFE